MLRASDGAAGQDTGDQDTVIAVELVPQGTNIGAAGAGMCTLRTAITVVCVAPKVAFSALEIMRVKYTSSSR